MEENRRAKNQLDPSNRFDTTESYTDRETQDRIHTVSQKKQDTKLLPTTSPNINQFSQFFHC